MIKFINKGFSREVTDAKYGSQDIGISPYGAMDIFAMQTARNTLGAPTATTYEFKLMPPMISVTEDGRFIVTGAHREIYVNGNRVEHCQVINTYANDKISFGNVLKGFRTYISFIKGTKASERTDLRKSFSDLKWPDKDGCIRVVKGPEYDIMENENFPKNWTVGAHDDMGMRINGENIAQKTFSMVSGPVADGTIQLTPTGPIILLRNRQTVGGYPRVLNVITADIDMLAHYADGMKFEFKLITIEEAIKIAKLKLFETISC